MTQRAVITKDVSDGTKNTTNLLLNCNNITLLALLQAEEKTI
jgi:hypothetical protein